MHWNAAFSLDASGARGSSGRRQRLRQALRQSAVLAAVLPVLSAHMAAMTALLPMVFAFDDLMCVGFRRLRFGG